MDKRSYYAVQLSYSYKKKEGLWAQVTGAFRTADEVDTNASFTYDWYIFSLIRLSDIFVFDNLCQF